MNIRLIAGIVLIVLGILVLIAPDLLSYIVGLALVIGGLWIALQNASAGGGGGGNI